MKLILLFLSLSISALSEEKRIISLSPAITEIIYVLKVEDRLVGVSDFSDFPPEALQKPRVGPYTKPLYEKIISLKPSLVLIPLEGPKDVLSRLQQLKVPHAVISMRELEEIPQAVKKIGRLLGEKKKAERVQKDWAEKLNSLRKKYLLRPTNKNVLVQIEHAPLIVAGRETFLDEIVALCGSKNIYGHKSGYPRLSTEAALKKKIDIILAVSHFDSENEKQSVIDFWKSLPPFKNTEIKFIDPDSASRPGPRLIDGAQAICKALEE